MKSAGAHYRHGASVSWKMSTQNLLKHMSSGSLKAPQHVEHVEGKDVASSTSPWPKVALHVKRHLSKRDNTAWRHLWTSQGESAKPSDVNLCFKSPKDVKGKSGTKAPSQRALSLDTLRTL